jgi:hypothetical protein
MNSAENLEERKAHQGIIRGFAPAKNCFAMLNRRAAEKKLKIQMSLRIVSRKDEEVFSQLLIPIETLCKYDFRKVICLRSEEATGWSGRVPRQ